MESALVTGATGFIGKRVVELLSEKGFKVKAGAHSYANQNIFTKIDNVEIVSLDVLNRESIKKAMHNVDYVYHFAALVSSHETREKLFNINAEGTRNVWEIAADNGVKSALYCSSTAVYGILSKSFEPVEETIKARAIEPYGNSKLAGETEVMQIAANKKLPSIIIRPVAVFGPDDHTSFGRSLRKASISKILLAGRLQKSRFNFVHVDDVAKAAHYLMENKYFGEIFNIVNYNPVLYEDAFKSYLNILDRSDGFNIKTKLIATTSEIFNKIPFLTKLIFNSFTKKYFFVIWQPGFDILYSSEKLLNTLYKFKWCSFEEILNSCLNGEQN